MLIGGLEEGAKCGVGETKEFSRQHPAPEGFVIVRAGISDEYEGTASTRIIYNGAAVIVGSRCEGGLGGQLAKYRWWAECVPKEPAKP